MKTLAINICILPSEVLKHICNKIYNKDRSEYSSESLEYIPHITLEQKAINEEDLDEIISQLSTIKLNSFEIEIGNFIYETLLGLEIKRNKNITELQKNILGITEKFKNAKLSNNSFLTEKYFFKDNFSWLEHINKFPNIDKDLHITLGGDNQLEKLKDLKIPVKFTFDTLCIGLMGNYCSVRKKLYEFKI